MGPSNPNLKSIILLRSLAGTLQMANCNFPETFLWNIANFNLSAFKKKFMILEMFLVENCT